MCNPPPITKTTFTGEHRSRKSVFFTYEKCNFIHLFPLVYYGGLVIYTHDDGGSGDRIMMCICLFFMITWQVVVCAECKLNICYLVVHLRNQAENLIVSRLTIYLIYLL